MGTSTSNSSGKFRPRTREEIEQGLAARFVARMRPLVTDLTESSSLRQVLAVISEEFELVEERLGGIRDAFWLDARGQDLDARLLDMPPGFTPRLGASPAAGPVLRVERSDTSATLEIPAGSLVAHKDDATLVYATTQTVTMAAGESVYPPDSATPPIQVVCTTHGARGNAASGTLTEPVNFPLDVTAVTNVAPVAGGTDRESDDDLKRRALLFLSGLARTQGAALLYLARTFQGTDGVRLRHAALLEDPFRPGYSELVVDDGSGMVGFTREGAEVTGVIPANGARSIYFEAPMVGPTYTVERGDGANWLVLTFAQGQDAPWLLQEERGLLFPRPEAELFSPGDHWRVRNYRVYTGVLRELQAAIEGDPRDVFGASGYRAAGTRVRVVAPTVQWVPFVVHLVADGSGVDVSTLRTTVRDELVAILAALGPGEAMRLDAVRCALRKLDGLRLVSIEEPAGDVEPADMRTVLRTRPDLVDVN